MFDIQKAGGIAALFEAIAYIVGFAALATLLNPGNTQDWDSTQKLAFLLERKALFQIWTIFIYVAFGVALVILTVALHERLKSTSLALMKIATPFGFIWAGFVIASGMVAIVGLETMATLHSQNAAQAALAWVAIGAIQDGIGGGVEMVGGLWVMLISTASLRTNALPSASSYLGLAVGLAGILTVVPSLSGLGAAFGFGQILWFAWIGVFMLRQTSGSSEHLLKGT